MSRYTGETGGFGMRLVLFVAVLALGADALLYNGAYTQAAWREASGHVERLLDKAPPAAGGVGRNG